MSTFYPRWLPRLAKLLGACQILIQHDAFCGRFLHDGDLQATPPRNIVPPSRKDRLRKIWVKVQKAFPSPEIEAGKSPCLKSIPLLQVLLVLLSSGQMERSIANSAPLRRSVYGTNGLHAR